LNLKLIASFAGKFWTEMDGVANGAGKWRVFKSIIFNGEAEWGMTQRRTCSLSVRIAINPVIEQSVVVSIAIQECPREISELTELKSNAELCVACISTRNCRPIAFASVSITSEHFRVSTVRPVRQDLL
jgi:hypothetical protein